MKTPELEPINTAADVALSYAAMGVSITVALHQQAAAALASLRAQSERDILGSFAEFDVEHAVLVEEGLASASVGTLDLATITKDAFSSAHRLADVVISF